MTDTQNVMAQNLVRCKHFRWLPGMAFFDEHGAQYRVQSEMHAKHIHDDRKLDLTDPATLGCLLALVREAWNKPDLHIRREADGWRAWTDEPGAFVYHTEAEALVRALEVAP